eukprot:scaffold22560_cov135-Cylindrotheca_fusiformis.AAC.47
MPGSSILLISLKQELTSKSISLFYCGMTILEHCKNATWQYERINGMILDPIFYDDDGSVPPGKGCGRHFAPARITSHHHHTGYLLQEYKMRRDFKILNPRVVKQIRRMVEKNHSPTVEVRKSCVSGRGVFALAPVYDEMLPMVACLYPGIYTPGMPFVDSVDSGNEYLADLIPPSGVPLERNEYIMNLQIMGGYIDGASLVGNNNRRLDANPSACGHLVNHDSSTANTCFISFAWDHIFVGSIEANQCELPNETRSDDSPWYFDGHIQRIKRFDNPCASVCGGAIVISKKVDVGDELLLDYRLKKPYPAWAKEWYI